jgi:hypothetical protein
MRVWITLAAALVAVAIACGGSSSSTQDAPRPKDARLPDAPPFDFGCGGSAACTTISQVCCAMPGTPTTFGCVAPASCPTADQITCDGPDECGGNTPVCCGTEAGNGVGPYPKCGVKSLSTLCTSMANCTTHLEQNCNDTSKVILCHVKSDCTDATNDHCCTFGSASASLTFCIDATTAALGSAACHP